MIKIKYINNKILSATLTVPLALALSACNGEVKMSPQTCSTLIAKKDIQDISQMDEQLYSGNLSDGNENYVDAADRLDRYIANDELLDSIDFTEADEIKPLAEAEQQDVLSLDASEINDLKNVLKKPATTPVEMENKLEALKKLYYLKNYYDNYISSRGKEISLNIMMASVKAAVADAIGLPPVEYNNVTLPLHGAYRPDEHIPYYIYAGGVKYYFSEEAKELTNTIACIYDLQSKTYDSNTTRLKYKNAINYAKTTIAAGAEVNGNTITELHDANYISKNYVAR